MMKCNYDVNRGQELNCLVIYSCIIKCDHEILNSYWNGWNNKGNKYKFETKDWNKFKIETKFKKQNMNLSWTNTYFIIFIQLLLHSYRLISSIIPSFKSLSKSIHTIKFHFRFTIQCLKYITFVWIK